MNHKRYLPAFCFSSILSDVIVQVFCAIPGFKTRSAKRLASAVTDAIPTQYKRDGIMMSLSVLRPGGGSACPAASA
jgi:hypothetical protein